MKSNITIVSSCDSFIVYFKLKLNFFIIKVWKYAEERRPKRRWNKIGFVKLVVIIFFIFNTRCGYVIAFDFR